MAQAQTFDLARTTFDSWPWMFGKQWDSIVDRCKEGGLENAAPQVHILAAWCTVFEDAEAVRRKLDEINVMKVKEGNREVPAPDWMKLQSILTLCVQIAKDNGAWVYNKKPEKKIAATREDLGRAL